MKSIFIHFLFIVISVASKQSFAQQNKIDSLLSLLKKDKEDTSKIIHLNNLSRELMNINPDTSIILSNRALAIAENLNTSTSALATVRKKGMAGSLGNLGVYYWLKSDRSKALDYYIKALKINEELLKEATGQREKETAQKAVATRLGNIGIVYADQGNFPKALDYFFKALKIKEELGDKSHIAALLGNIGIVYKEQGHYLNALNYYFKALKICEELGSKSNIASWLGNIGIIYKEENNYPKALDYYFKALKINQEIGNKKGTSTLLGNIGNLYSDQASETPALSISTKKQLQSKALDYYFKALKMKEELGNKIDISINLGNIGSFYSEQKKYREAFDYIYRALALDDITGAMNVAKDHYEMLSTLYEVSNIPLPDSVGGKLLNMEQMRLRSLYYHKRYISIRDTLFSQENNKQLVRKEMNFEFEKKEASSKAEHEKKDALSKAEAKRQRMVLLLVSCVLLLVAAVTFAVFRSLRITRRQKNVIERQKQIVEEKQKEILDSIYYAKRIQTALLPSAKQIDKNLNRLKK